MGFARRLPVLPVDVVDRLGTVLMVFGGAAPGKPRAGPKPGPGPTAATLRGTPRLGQTAGPRWVSLVGGGAPGMRGAPRAGRAPGGGFGRGRDGGTPGREDGKGWVNAWMEWGGALGLGRKRCRSCGGPGPGGTGRVGGGRPWGWLDETGGATMRMMSSSMTTGWCGGWCSEGEEDGRVDCGGGSPIHVVDTGGLNSESSNGRPCMAEVGGRGVVRWWRDVDSDVDVDTRRSVETIEKSGADEG